LPETKCCNLCGKPLDEWDLQEDFTIHTTVGYGSKYDLSKVHLQLCCDCFDKIVDSCKISPVIGEVHMGVCYYD
jgi:hypothetical protein